MRAGRQTDMTKLEVAFRYFANETKEITNYKRPNSHVPIVFMSQSTPFFIRHFFIFSLDQPSIPTLGMTAFGCTKIRYLRHVEEFLQY